MFELRNNKKLFKKGLVTLNPKIILVFLLRYGITYVAVQFAPPM